MSDPLISVIVPVCNGDKYLSEALDSVLAQTYKPIEIILVDDGSTDRTSQIVNELQLRHPYIHYHFQENQGLAASRNRGISLARADFIAFIDADDIWEPEKLTSQMNLIEKNQDVEMVSGKVRQFISPEVPESERHKYRFRTEDMQTNMMTAVLLRKTVFETYGYFNPDLLVGPDMDWVLHAMEKGLKVMPLPELVYYRRLHPQNKGRIRQTENYLNRFRILKGIIDQRRDQKKRIT